MEDNMEKKTEKLCFYTTGDNFTGLVRMFWNEGSIRKVSEILDQLPSEIKHKICTGKMKFEGDTRKGDQTCEGKDSEVQIINFKNKFKMKHKFSINHLTLAFASLLLYAAFPFEKYFL